HFGFRLRLVDNLQPIGGARQRPRREDGKRRVFALHTAQTRPTPRFRSLHERPGGSSLLFPPGNTRNALDRDGRTRSRDDAPSTVSHARWSLAAGTREDRHPARAKRQNANGWASNSKPTTASGEFAAFPQRPARTPKSPRPW